jgi:hypothetical protein
MLARAMRLIAGLALLAIFGFAGYWSVRVAWAESLARSDSRSEVRSAIRMAPADAEYHLRLASLLSRDGMDPRPELIRAAALKPDDGRIWMLLAAESEARGDLAGAEQALRRAAQTSRQFEPRWRLANFYFRRGDAGQFWRWARDALPLTYDDPVPLFRLCRQMPEADEALERILPDEPRLLRGYLTFLAADKDLARADKVAAKLAPLAGTADLPDLLAYCDRSLGALRGDPALRIWNSLARRGLVQRAPLDPEHGNFVSNGDFTREPVGHGFDWRLAPSLPGVNAVRIGPGGGLRITFSGRQPEICDLLWQWIPAGGRDRRLCVQYRTAGVAPSSGLRLTVVDAASGKEIAAVPLSSDTWASAETHFPPRLARIVLSYRRGPGTTRIEGSVELRRMDP